MQVSIKNIDERTFREFKAKSAIEGISVGKALTLAMGLLLEQKREKKMSLLNLKPKDWGKGTEKLSEEIDEIAY